MRKQYHFWPSSDGAGLDAWDVDRLIMLTHGLPASEVALDDIAEIDSAYWFDDSKERATVRKVVEHIQLIGEVDPSHPIILGPDGRVMDGMHRIARALLDGRTTISAVQLDTLPDPDYRSCHPKDLPYE